MRGRKCLPLKWIYLPLLPMVAFVLSGCAQSEPTLKVYSGPTLARENLGVGELSCGKTGHVVLQDEPTTGCFPLALAVARLETPDWYQQMKCADPNSWQLATIPSAQASRWNSLFNTMSNVREVVLLDRLSVRNPGTEVKTAEIVRAAAEAEASLCLIYGPAEAPDDYAAFMGVIVDTASGKPVAFAKADAGRCDADPPHPDKWKEDLSYLDPNTLAMRKFEKQVRTCVLELIRNDQPATTTRPSPWLGVEPDYEDRPMLILPDRPDQ